MTMRDHQNIDKIAWQHFITKAIRKIINTDVTFKLHTVLNESAAN